MNVAEAKVIDGLKPEDFKCFFENWAPASVEINDTVKRVDKCDEEEGHDVYKMEINFPWPLWNRLMILTLYKRLDQPDGSQICFFSCDGNDAMKEKHFDENDKKNFVLGTQPIGGWILTPIKNEAGEVTGTNMMFANSANVQGNVPATIVNS